MPPADTAEIRIYCICGQKMKVAPSMLGRNGKCVACRQKIRIPRADELPRDGSPVYLKDQPQFLRMSTPRPRAAEAAAPDVVEAEEFPLGGEDSGGDVIALDVLPALQRLCSLEQKVHRHLEMLNAGVSRIAGDGHDKATLMRYRSLARQARASLDDELRQRLIEIRDQLEETGADLTRENMAFRLAETALTTYQDRVAALRQRRERLARRLQNVRGWLATNDPQAAGGLVDVALEDVPTDAPEVTFSLEPVGDRPLAQEYVDRLRAALDERDEAERRLAELRRMRDEGAVEAEGAEEVRAEAEAAVTRTRAAVAYYRVRLEQCLQDADHDNGAVLAHLGVLRDRLARKQVDALDFPKLEAALLRAQQDVKQLRDVAKQAVSATTSGEIPDLRPTLMDRLSRPGSSKGMEVDSWVAFVAAVIMIVNIVAPFSSAEMGGNRIITMEAAVGLFVTAVLVSLTAFIARREVRGTGYVLLWTVATLLGCMHIYEAWYSRGEVGKAMRLDADWYTSPGILLLVVSSGTLAIAAVAALHRRRRHRRLLAASGIIVFGSVLFLHTDAAGYWRPMPRMDAPALSERPTWEGGTGVGVTLRNTGRRPFWLGGNAAIVPAPYHFAFERALGDGAWEEVGRPEAAAPVGAEERIDALVAPLVSDLQEVAPGGQIVVKQSLPPGVYRARLAPRMRGLPELAREFEVPEPEGGTPQPVAASNGQGPKAAGADPQSPVDWTPPPATPPPAALLPQVEVTLRGVLNPAGRPPSFVVSVRDASGAVEQRRVGLGDPIAGTWAASEFNPEFKTLTLSNGERMVILESGQPVVIPVTPPRE